MACGGSRAYLRATRSRRTRNLGTVETLTARISELVARRQELRREDASIAAIERNRLEIARLQWDLAHALIDRYLPSRSAA
jgi:hypothetical protein